MLLVRTWQKFGGSGRQEGAGSYPLPHMAILPLPVDISRGTFVITEQKPGEPLHLKLIKQKGGKERGSRIISNQPTKTAGAGGSINIPLCVMTSPTQLYTGTLLRTSKCIYSNQVKPSLGCSLCIDLINIHQHWIRSSYFSEYKT